MTIGPLARGKPTLEQGCLLSAGVFVLSLGGCVAAFSWNPDWGFSDWVFSDWAFLCLAAGGLSGLIGLVLLIARFDRRLRRE